MIFAIVFLIFIVAVIVNGQNKLAAQEKKGFGDYNVAINKANSFYKINNYQKAIDHYYEAKRVRPSNYGTSEPEYQIGKCLYYIGQYKEVLNHTQFQCETDKLFFKSKASIKLGDKKQAKYFIDQGLKLNYSLFFRLKDEIINPNKDLDFYWQALGKNEKQRLLKNIKHNSSNDKISQVDFSSLIALEHLDLSCRTETIQFKQTYVQEEGYFINDLSFLRYFTNLKYLNLCGQKYITEFPEVEKLMKIEEINFAYTSISNLVNLSKCINLKFLNFYSTSDDDEMICSIRKALPKCNINLTITNQYEINSNLRSLIEPSWIEKHTKYFEDLRIFFKKLNSNNQNLPYPKVLFPKTFIDSTADFKNEKIPEPVFDRPAIQTRGASEKVFYPYLKKYFKNKIFDNAALEKHKAYLPKFPDFLLADFDNRIFIDIEIDEPYAFSTGEPTHCIGEDDDRNFEFLYNHWFVIRFTEEQVLRVPDECCDFILKISLVIQDRINGNYSDFDFAFSFKQHPWNKEDALKLKSNKHREKYLVSK